MADFSVDPGFSCSAKEEFPGYRERSGKGFSVGLAEKPASVRRGVGRDGERGITH
ncbi:MAG: hypothetical protein WHT09_06915 [Thermogutta sp.]|uniref:hypothetical protein n=1 Tax=Thermogutta terrifontis TaxID=1331910 RepID=UPI0012FE1254|nr:hypothetical protein [Thermogutta terrifontis]